MSWIAKVAKGNSLHVFGSIRMERGLYSVKSGPPGPQHQSFYTSESNQQSCLYCWKPCSCSPSSGSPHYSDTLRREGCSTQYWCCTVTLTWLFYLIVEKKIVFTIMSKWYYSISLYISTVAFKFMPTISH